MKRVSLAEQLFITPAFMLVLCWQYWLWSRTDWKPEYAHTKWQLIPIFLLVILVWRGLSYQKERLDELASANMKRCDAICYKVAFCLLLVIAFAGGILSHVELLNAVSMGWMILALLFAMSILRTALFVLFDKKGM